MRRRHELVREYGAKCGHRGCGERRHSRLEFAHVKRTGLSGTGPRGRKERMADINAHIERGGEAYTSYLANITKNGELWKVNVSPSNATISEASLTDASNTYNVSALYDTVSGENVNFDFQPITITWGTPGEGASGPVIQPPTVSEIPIPTPEVPPENIQFGILIIVGVLLASYSLYSVDKKSKSKKWKDKTKDLKRGKKWG